MTESQMNCQRKKHKMANLTYNATWQLVMGEVDKRDAAGSFFPPLDLSSS
jgi:hypothetical protein